jgi:hypothetical protein
LRCYIKLEGKLPFLISKKKIPNTEKQHCRC